MSATLTLDGLSRAIRLVDEVDDCESPAGANAAWDGRIGEFQHIYRGTGDPHLIDQPCWPESIDEAGADQADCFVAFACGCRGLVPASTLVRRELVRR
jgi:hypothetical protein